MRYINPGASGFFALTLVTVLAAGCSNSDPGRANGNVRFTMGGNSTQAATLGAATTPLPLTGGDGRTIESAGITLSSILARNLDGELIGVTMDLPVDIDLIALINGRMVELPMGSLPAGSYDQLVVVIRSLHVVLSDGLRIDVTPPGGGWTAVVNTEPFDVVDGAVTTVNLRFRSERAFRWVEGQLEFNPEFDCDVDDRRGDDDDDD